MYFKKHVINPMFFYIFVNLHKEPFFTNIRLTAVFYKIMRSHTIFSHIHYTYIITHFFIFNPYNHKGIYTMFIDTHCHINYMIKPTFDAPFPTHFEPLVTTIIEQAQKHNVSRIVNVGTSMPESEECIRIAQVFPNCWATIGTHPNDLKTDWMNDIKQYDSWLKKKEFYKIIGIGEIGLDYHYPDYNKQRQYDACKAQIELALEYDLPIVIHTRDAGMEVLHIIEEFKQNNIHGIIHCFSEDHDFAKFALELGFILGIGGTLTYPKNKILRDIFSAVPLTSIVLETDAPFLPPQALRGQKNHPMNIALIAQFLATLRGITLEEVGQVTTKTALKLFNITI